MLKLGAIVALIALTGLIPVITQHPYYLHVAITIAVFTIVSLGVRLLLLIGQWTFGQAAFMTIGSYASAMLTGHLGWSFWSSMPMAGLIAAAAAALFGYPALRLTGAYFAMVTLILNIVVRQIILVTPDLTGGSMGLRLDIQPPDPISLPFGGGVIVFSDKVSYYYLIWLLGLAAVGIAYWIDRSPMGAVLRAVRQSEILVRSVGIDSAIYKLLAFVIACFFAGIAGSFYAHYLILAHPDAFSLWDSIYAVAYVVIGGTSTVLGPILGTALLIGGFELLREASAYQTVGYALILLLVTRFLPGGLISLGPMSTDFLTRRRRRRTRIRRARRARGPGSAHTCAADDPRIASRRAGPDRCGSLPSPGTVRGPAGTNLAPSTALSGAPCIPEGATLRVAGLNRRHRYAFRPIFPQQT